MPICINVMIYQGIRSTESDSIAGPSESSSIGVGILSRSRDVGGCGVPEINCEPLELPGYRSGSRNDQESFGSP